MRNRSRNRRIWKAQPAAGLMAAGVALLSLPLCAAVLGSLVQSPAAAEPAPAAAPDAGPAPLEEAIARRKSWLDEAALAAKARLSLARKAARAPARQTVRTRPVKVIHTRASWYGPGFHGRRTASGERFDQHALTLASRHLPFGTRVRVVNLKTGRSAVGRVNDRGPFHPGRGADLSRALARRIGMNGTARVRLEILPRGAKH